MPLPQDISLREERGNEVALEDYEVDTSPDDVDRVVAAEETRSMYRQVAKYIPALCEECVCAVSCFYTVPPDVKFVIDTHPDDDCIIIALPCSGHGFKHSAAIGEALFEMAIHGKSTLT